MTLEQAHIVAKVLVVTPKAKFIPGKYKHYSQQPVEESVQIYYKVENDVYIPYMFARKFFKSVPIPKPLVNIPFIGQLRENQIPKAQEALQQLHEYGTTTLQLDTAYGKTYISAYLASQLNRLTLVMFNMDTLRSQWIKTFEAATRCYIWDVKKKMPDIVSVIVCSTGSISHIPEQLLSQVGTLILDESHKLCTPSSITPILKVTPEYIIASSYTYDRTDSMHQFMDAVVGLHRVHGKLDINMTAVTCYTGIKYAEVAKNNQGHTDWTALVKQMCNCEARNQFIAQLVLSNLHRKIMVLTPLVEHAEYLSNMFQRLGISSDYITGKKRKYVDSQVLVGSIGKVNTGFDEKNYCDTFNGIHSNMLINIGSNKEPNLIIQIAGRLKRTNNVVLVDVVDDMKIFHKHAKERKKIYERENYTILETQGLYIAPEHE